jgi:hypothetical protein
MCARCCKHASSKRDRYHIIARTYATISVIIFTLLFLSSLYLRSSMLPEPLLSLVVMLNAAPERLTMEGFLLNPGEPFKDPMEPSEAMRESEVIVGRRLAWPAEGELGTEPGGPSSDTPRGPLKSERSRRYDMTDLNPFLYCSRIRCCSVS